MARVGAIRRIRRKFGAAAIAAAIACGHGGILGGCAAKAAPEYARSLPEGGVALRLLPPEAPGPDLAAVWHARSEGLLASIDHPLGWFEKPSSRRFQPHRVLREDRFAEIDHAHAAASQRAFREVLASSDSAEAFEREVRRRFEIYESVGWDGSGAVLFTGCCAPIFEASPEASPDDPAPLHRRPPGLATAADGTPLGRRLPDGSVVPWPPRAELERSGRLDGLEFVWLRSSLDAYIVQVNGSAKLRMPDGSFRLVGYAGKTDRPYSGLGRVLVEEGLVPAERLGLSAVRAAYRRDPAAVERLMARNESFVFLDDYPAAIWPAGSLGAAGSRWRRRRGPAGPRRRSASGCRWGPVGPAPRREATFQPFRTHWARPSRLKRWSLPSTCETWVVRVLALWRSFFATTAAAISRGLIGVEPTTLTIASARVSPLGLGRRGFALLALPLAAVSPVSAAICASTEASCSRSVAACFSSWGSRLLRRASSAVRSASGALDKDPLRAMKPVLPMRGRPRAGREVGVQARGDGHDLRRRANGEC